jgi:hypothetical protein
MHCTVFAEVVLARGWESAAAGARPDIFEASAAGSIFVSVHWTCDPTKQIVDPEIAHFNVKSAPYLPQLTFDP